MDVRIKILLFGLFPWLFTLAVLMYLVIPGFSNLGTLRDDLSEKKDDLERLEQQVFMVKNTKKIQKEMGILNDIMDNFDVKVPEKKELDVLTVDLERIAQKLNLPLFEITVKPPKEIHPDDTITKNIIFPKDKKDKTSTKKKKAKYQQPEFFVQEMPLTTYLNGSFQNLKDLLSQLYYYNRLISVSSITLDKESSGLSGSGDLGLTVDFNIHTCLDVTPVIVEEENSEAESEENSSE